jgi:hypothetical protein
LSEVRGNASSWREDQGSKLWITEEGAEKAKRAAIEATLHAYSPNRFQTLWRGGVIDICFGSVRSFPQKDQATEVMVGFPLAVSIDPEMARQLADELIRYLHHVKMAGGDADES